MRLLSSAEVLDEAVDVAKGNILRREVSQSWLRSAAAPSPQHLPDARIVRWLGLFNDELEVIRRARNNILLSEPIEDGNLAAAAGIAETIQAAARVAAKAADREYMSE